MPRVKHGNQHSQHPKKHKKQACVSICDALLSHDLFMFHALTQEIRTIKTFIKYKSTTAD